MYLAFRSVELARTLSPEKAVEEALDLRFLTRGELATDGSVYSDAMGRVLSSIPFPGYSKDEFSPFKIIFNCFGIMLEDKIFKRVDFPEPDKPTIPISSPLLSSKEISLIIKGSSSPF